MAGLDPDVAALLDSMQAAGAPPLWSLSLAEAREQLAAATAQLAPETPHVDSQDLMIAGAPAAVPIRIYRPGRNVGQMVLLIHGGGWALGSIETHDAIAHAIAAGADATVVSVDYRLAPEHPFPAGFHDCIAALAWCDRQRLPGQSLVVMGDSAGANLAAALALHARDNQGPRIDAQILIYPCVDLTASPPYASRTAYGGGEYFLGQQDIDWLRGMYLADAADTENPCVSPMRAESLSGLPQALIVTAGHDPLCDEGLAYHRRLAGAGVPSQRLHFGGTIHGFLSFAGALSSGRDALARIIDWLSIIRNR
jgi:acetyl esterase